jgi:peptidoglycan/xylan/chitin deacetylase (PgdA/CDA1 family)
MSRNNAAMLVIMLLLFAQLPLLVVTFGNNNDPIIFLAHAKKSLSSSASHHVTRTRGRTTKIPSPSLSSSAARPLPIPNTNNLDNSSSIINEYNKVVMINFDDSYKTQFLYAKPILDKYGFKATFFEVCGWIGKSSEKQTWQDIAALHRDGMDIESHTMTHAHLNTLSAAALNYEIGGSKQCFLNHGYNTTIFGYPVNSGSNMSSVVNIVAKYYSLARTGSDSLMYLHCNGYKEDPHQTDCRTYSADGKLTYANRYDIRSKSFDHISNSYIAYTPTQLFQQFVQRVNSQLQYNKDGIIKALPIIVYHNLTYSDQVYNELPSTITVPLFAAEMKYLHDNGFKVLTINQLGYDTASNILYIKGAPISNNYSLLSPIASKIVTAPPHPTTTTPIARADCHTFIPCLQS